MNASYPPGAPLAFDAFSSSRSDTLRPSVCRDPAAAPFRRPLDVLASLKMWTVSESDETQSSELTALKASEKMRAG